MGKSKKKPLPPRVKRMSRPARLQSAKQWIATYTGKNLLRGYCNHFGVDWRCAALELKMLGRPLDADYLKQRERTEAEAIRRRKAQKEAVEAMRNQHWHPYTDAFSAYLAEDFAAMHDIESSQSDNVCDEE